MEKELALVAGRLAENKTLLGKAVLELEDSRTAVKKMEEELEGVRGELAEGGGG